MHKIIVANYKMNGDKKFFVHVNKAINKMRIKDANLILCPPFLYVPFFKIKNKCVRLGSQDVSSAEYDKHTGQICAKMLSEFGVKYSIVGHSEQRKIGETDEVINQKIIEAQKVGITPILCVGEENDDQNIQTFENQIVSALKNCFNDNIIFAYEPIWAIGTGKVPSLTRINKAITFIRKTAKNYNIKAIVLYGGSVGINNYRELLKSKSDGFLIGESSLKLNEFKEIVKGIDDE